MICRVKSPRQNEIHHHIDHATSVVDLFAKLSTKIMRHQLWTYSRSYQLRSPNISCGLIREAVN